MSKHCKKCLLVKKDDFFLIDPDIGQRMSVCSDCYFWDYLNEIEKSKPRLLRQKVIAALGGECVWCGFSDPRALQIDHVNDGGSQIRRDGQSWSQFYREILEGTHDQPVQLLCANCNWIKRYKRDM